VSKTNAADSVTPGQKIYFLGIGGTGMSSVAGLCQEAGFLVCGSDAGIYPPTSTMLESLKIPYRTPYNPDNISDEKPDLVVIANVLSRGNLELEKVIAEGLTYTSFPQLLGDLFLKNRVSCVIAGTHGKTTTTALLSHILVQLGEDPGFLIGGLPKNSDRSFVLGKGPIFVIEGDEYDTAFFDKGPKFLHYHPQHLILNNIEFDHADIYRDLNAVIEAFEKLVKIVKNPRYIIANCDDKHIMGMLKNLGLEKAITRCSTLGQTTDADVRILESGPENKSTHGSNSMPLWKGLIETKKWGTLEIETQLTGNHNFSNIAQVIACVINLEFSGALKKPIKSHDLIKALRSFEPPKRRLDLLGTIHNTMIFEDFAHHPTAVRMVLESLKMMYPNRKITVAFEPRSATNRRNIFHKEYVNSLGLADFVLIGEVLNDQRIPADQRFNSKQLALDIGPKARSFEKNIELLQYLEDNLNQHEIVVFMSSGSFSGIQHMITKSLK
jgi:UDP-N-acetylmuramate: L-alanyl-gamma-D-glutamyl-meso-diaminopimelate ligase